MKEVGAYEAKTHLPKLLDDVQKGETIVITRHGVPVAHLVPARPKDSRSVGEILEDIKRIRKSLPPLGCSVRDLIEEGRRF